MRRVCGCEPCPMHAPEPPELRAALTKMIEGFARLHDEAVDMTNFMHRAGTFPNRCGDCGLLTEARAAILQGEPNR